MTKPLTPENYALRGCGLLWRGATALQKAADKELSPKRRDELQRCVSQAIDAYRLALTQFVPPGTAGLGVTIE